MMFEYDLIDNFIDGERRPTHLHETYINPAAIGDGLESVLHLNSVGQRRSGAESPGCGTKAANYIGRYIGTWRPHPSNVVIDA